MKKITKTPILTLDNDMSLSFPTTIHIELTSSCCFSCRHCYNFWRRQKSKTTFMSQHQLDSILDELIDNGIMHIIFTGGEPLLNSKLLLHGIRRLKEAGLSLTCNSTLAVKNSFEEMRKLKEVGLEHILSSLNSYRPQITDHLASVKGAHKKIIEGIKNAVSAGIRISINMIISKNNIKDIYKTAKLAHKLGAKKFFGTRVVPHISKEASRQKEFLIYQKEARYIIDQLIKVENDFGMQVGSLVPFPLCFIANKDGLDKYVNFYSHGCPAGNKMMSLNANGDAHACVHESKKYGNIFEIGIKGAWENMRKWRSGEFFPDDCKKCPLFDECNGGCRLCTLAYAGNISSTDNLRMGWDRKVQNSHGLECTDLNLREIKCMVPQNLRFRKENGFYIIDRFGSEILCIKNEIAEILQDYQNRQKAFCPGRVGIKDHNIIKKLAKEKLLTISTER